MLVDITSAFLDVESSALNVRGSYFHAFDNTSTLEISSHNEMQRDVQGIDTKLDSSWFKEARRTAKNFRGRPQIGLIFIYA